ncbi:hypothetical protein BLNAU_14883 [Blattamonas nauphoetae]|uniref:Uncharacterized protein n=1 Tax=Blattamonas nauphoetae TaxID=2049346 RepID=A0ABQ9XCF4_9EUKA|nr:hypothetical protein BLNAU_14883 [Blattamonas nauphoetae]
MAEEPDSLKTSDETLSNDSLESPWTPGFYEEPFLYFNENSELSFYHQSAIYNSLVALVKARHPFDKALQDRAARFLQNLGPKWNKQDSAQLVTELVPSSDGSCAGFVASIVTLLSSPHLTVVTAALSFVRETIMRASAEIRCRLVDFDLITKVLATVQPHTLPISGNETIFDNLLKIITLSLQLATPGSLRNLGITAADIFNLLEMIFQRVVLPSSQFVTFLISNRFILNGGLFDSFMNLLHTFLKIFPFHRPTLEYVLASPIAMAYSSCFSVVEYDRHFVTPFININDSLTEWKKEGPEVAQSGKRMMQALISEGFEDTLEQMMKHDIDGTYGLSVVQYCQSRGRNCLSRMTPTHFCGLSSDVGNALIAGADESTLGWPPIVQKWCALLGSSFSTRLSLIVTSSTVLSPNNSLHP